MATTRKQRSKREATFLESVKLDLAELRSDIIIMRNLMEDMVRSDLKRGADLPPPPPPPPLDIDCDTSTDNGYRVADQTFTRKTMLAFRNALIGESPDDLPDFSASCSRTVINANSLNNHVAWSPDGLVLLRDNEISLSGKLSKANGNDVSCKLRKDAIAFMPATASDRIDLFTTASWEAMQYDGIFVFGSRASPSEDELPVEPRVSHLEPSFSAGKVLSSQTQNEDTSEIYFERLHASVHEPTFALSLSEMLEHIWVEYGSLCHELTNPSFCNEPYDSLMCTLRVLEPWNDKLPEHILNDQLTLNRGQLLALFSEIGRRNLSLHSGPIKLPITINMQLGQFSKNLHEFQASLLEYMGRFTGNGPQGLIKEGFHRDIQNLLQRCNLMSDGRVPTLHRVQEEAEAILGEKPTMQWVSDIFFLIFKDIERSLETITGSASSSQSRRLKF